LKRNGKTSDYSQDDYLHENETVENDAKLLFKYEMQKWQRERKREREREREREKEL